MGLRKVIITSSLLSAFVVLGVTAPLAYYGVKMLDKRIETEKAAFHSVVINLKTEALEELKTAGTSTSPDQEMSAGSLPPAVSTALSELSIGVSELKQSVADLQVEQKNLVELMNLRTEGLITMAKVEPEPVRPGSRDDTLNQTIYFALGVFHGAKTDQQVRTVIAKIQGYSTAQNCVSNVMGFSDTLGGDKSNLELSQKRAEHVATLLRKEQVPVGSVKGWGERWLDIHTVDGIKNDKNRRVVVETLCGNSPAETAASTS